MSLDSRIYGVPYARVAEAAYAGGSYMDLDACYEVIDEMSLVEPMLFHDREQWIKHLFIFESANTVVAETLTEEGLSPIEWRSISHTPSTIVLINTGVIE